MPYSNLEEVYVVGRWDQGNRFCIRLVVADGSLLLQVNMRFRDMHIILFFFFFLFFEEWEARYVKDFPPLHIQRMPAVFGRTCLTYLNVSRSYIKNVVGRTLIDKTLQN